MPTLAIVGALLIAAFLTPFYFLQNGWIEWTNPYWFMQIQSEYLRHGLLPSPFINSPSSGWMYPNNLFYAGVELAIMGAFSTILGAWNVFFLSLWIAYFATFFSIWYVGTAITNRPKLGFLMGLAVTTTPYWITNTYGRGAWAELMGASATCVTLASITAVLIGRSQRERIIARQLLPAAVFILATVHNVSLLISALALPAILLSLIVFSNFNSRTLLRRLALVVGLTLIGISMAAIVLLPNLMLGPWTLIHSWNLTQANPAFDSLRVIFSPIPYTPPTRDGSLLKAQTCVPVAFAALLGALIGFSSIRRQNMIRRYLGLLLISMAIVITVLGMTSTQTWEYFPAPVRAIQFPYRLHSMLAVEIVILFGMLSRISGRRHRRIMAMLLFCAVLLQTAFAFDQAVTTPATAPPGIRPATASDIVTNEVPVAFSTGWAAPIQFRLTEPPALPLPAASINTRLDRPMIGDIVSLHPVRAGVFSTSVVYSPLIRATGGAHILGRAGDGTAIVVIAGRSANTATIVPVCTGFYCLSLSRAIPRFMQTSAWLTLLGFAAWLSIALGEFYRARRLNSR